ncbi:MAG: SRPBCC domain-containing protein [Dermatophilaceae bacterium]
MSESQQAEVVTEDAQGEHTVEVNALLPHDIDRVWHVLTTNDGAEAFLGEGARLGSKGETWHAADGSHGVWRSYHPLEQVRVSWHATADAPRSLVDLHLAPQGDHTAVSVRHERIQGDAAALSDRWRTALARIDALAED